MSHSESEPLLPVVRVGEIDGQSNTPRWLVEQLWGASAVGVIGGAPKCSKTWLGLDMALSVATGTACLGKYAVPQPGPVLIYLAEDALAVVRQRVAGMARHRGLDLSRVDIHVITAPVLRLDCDAHRTRLFETARKIQPRLHHARKNVALGVSPGQGLRGSSDLHAFGDSNLYLRRSKERLVLSTEHRAAPATPPVVLELVATSEETTHLEVVAEPRADKRPSLEEQVLTLLPEGVALPRSKLRETLLIKNERLGDVLDLLEHAGRIRRTSSGWQRNT